MKTLIKYFLVAALLMTGSTSLLMGQEQDWRNAAAGNSIYPNGYCDQPYVLGL